MPWPPGRAAPLVAAIALAAAAAVVLRGQLDLGQLFLVADVPLASFASLTAASATFTESNSSASGSTTARKTSRSS